MKVRCYISSLIEKEVEIDDKFKPLAVEHPWTEGIPNELYKEAVKAVEKATGAQMTSDEENHFICSVEDAETGILMLEG